MGTYSLTTRGDLESKIQCGPEAGKDMETKRELHKVGAAVSRVPGPSPHSDSH